jgi:hypothetical protein
MTNPVRSRWVADPLILESAFQLSAVWGFEQSGSILHPMYAKTYRQYRQFFPGEVTAVFEVNAASEKQVCGNFTFMDENQKIVARMTDYTAKKKTHNQPPA